MNSTRPERNSNIEKMKPIQKTDEIKAQDSEAKEDIFGDF